LNSQKASTASTNSRAEYISTIIDSIQDIKGKNIVKLDLTKLEERPADYFIICQGESSTQVKSIAENVKLRLKDELNIIPVSSEGIDGAKWILVDYFDVIVHVFYPETRDYYDLEDLWGDAEMTNYEDIV